MTTFGGYSTNDAAEIHRRVLSTKFAQPAVDNAKNLTVLNKMYYVIMQSALAVAEDPYTGYTQAYGKVVRYVQPNNNTLDMEDAVNASSKLLVTNRSITFSAAEGDLVLIIRNESEWTPITPGASSIRHAIVKECMGGGYYRGELATMAFVVPTDNTPGTAVYTGTGTGTGTGGSQCDDCDNVVPDTDSNGCAEAVQPSRVVPVGNGTAIFMYDPRPTPLIIGGHAIVAYISDNADTSAAGVQTGTGTGTSQDTDSIWMVLNGNYPIVGIPDRYYECCPDGTVILTRCDLYVVEGVLCPGTTISCPATTGTGTP